MKTLKTMGQVIKKKRGLRGYLHSRMAHSEPPRPRINIHASDVTNEDRKYCPREQALLDVLGEKPEDKWISTSLRYTFDMGNVMADYIRDTYLADIAAGDWKCAACGSNYTFCVRPHKCSTCGRREFKYVERRFKSLASGMSCGVDLLVKLPGESKYRVVELKTMEKEEFKALAAPLSEHRLRTNLYLRLIDESGSEFRKAINLEEGLVLYLCKGFGFKDTTLYDAGINEVFSPFKEFYVQRVDDDTEAFSQRATAVTEWRRTGVMPAGVENWPGAPRCKKCPVREKCWGGEYQAGAFYDHKYLGA